MSDSWTPACVEDDLLVAFVAVKRGFQGMSLGGDPGRFPILHHLAVAGASRQGPLAEGIGLDASTVSRHVRALLEDGLVVAERDPDDGHGTRYPYMRILPPVSFTVSIAGASGYAGAELIRLVASHPELTLGALAAGAQAGRPVTAVTSNPS